MLLGVVPDFGNAACTAESFANNMKLFDKRRTKNEESSIFHSKVGFQLVMLFLQFQ